MAVQPSPGWPSNTARSSSRASALPGCSRLLGVASGVGDAKGCYTHAEEVYAFLKRSALEWLYEEKADK
jgi:hypothetical protein